MTFDEWLDKSPAEGFVEKFNPVLQALWNNKNLVYAFFIHGHEHKDIHRLLAGMANALVFVEEFGMPELPKAAVEGDEGGKVEGGELGNFDIGDIVGHKPEEQEDGNEHS